MKRFRQSTIASLLCANFRGRRRFPPGVTRLQHSDTNKHYSVYSSSPRVTAFGRCIPTAYIHGALQLKWLSMATSEEKETGDSTTSDERKDTERVVEVEKEMGGADLQGESRDSAEADPGQQTESACDLDAGDERYLYMQRGFTTEIYKIEISNMPRHVGYKQMKKYLKGLDLNPVKIKKLPQQTFCFVTFSCEEDKQTALKALKGAVWKKQVLSVKAAAPALDPLYRRKRKRSVEGLDEEDPPKKQQLENRTLEERLSEAVTPLLMLPYKDQLQSKTSAMKALLRKAANVMTRRDNQPGAWFIEHVRELGGIMCAMDDIKASPVQTGYRNKCEFSIGMDAESQQPVVGFRLGSYEEGNFTVVSPDSCMHISRRMKDFAQVFREYFQHSSLPPFNHITGSGYWNQVAVRCYETGESMVVVQLHPQSLTQDEMFAERKKLIDFFTTGDGVNCCPTSLYFLSSSRKTSGAHKIEHEHLYGAKCVHEDILGMRFRISPDAFFQVNTRATEVLYSLVRELSACHEESTMLDICCGTGTIGLLLAKMPSVKHVVGIEMVEQAVQDARANAELNGVSNVEFLCGKAEVVLPKTLEGPSGQRGRVIGVVDPPRNGLHPHVIQTIRKCSAIDRLVYVSCNPSGAVGNFIDLCKRQTNRIKGLPFLPVKAVPVDLFPHTRHCELVILFRRLREDELITKVDPSTATSEPVKPSTSTETTKSCDPPERTL